jgi:hypothetical protein
VNAGRSVTRRGRLGWLLLSLTGLGAALLLYVETNQKHAPMALPIESAPTSFADVPAARSPDQASGLRSTSDGRRANDTQGVPRRSMHDATLATAGAGASIDPNPASGATPPPETAAEVISESWSQQALDQSWSQTVQHYVETNLEDLNTRGRLLDVSCRQTLCRVLMEFEDTDEVNRYGDDAANPNVHRWIQLKSSENGVVLEVFFGRS